MQATVIQESGQVIIKLQGRFDFNTHREFRAAYEPLLSDVSVIALSVDFRDVVYLDSSALGMLLMLRERFAAQGVQVALIGVQGNVKQVLDIPNFSKLFQIQN
mgnify:CR=1 FL=1